MLCWSAISVVSVALNPTLRKTPAVDNRCQWRFRWQQYLVATRRVDLGCYSLFADGVECNTLARNEKRVPGLGACLETNCDVLLGIYMSRCLDESTSNHFPLYSGSRSVLPRFNISPGYRIPDYKAMLDWKSPAIAIGHLRKTDRTS